MADHYDVEQIKRLQGIIDEAELHSQHAPARYDAGHIFDIAIKGVHPAVTGRAKLEALKFVGGGFAGQVYRCRLLELDLGGESIPGLETGGICNIKIMIPPSGLKRRFRDALYWIGYQSSFSMQVNEDAVRTGALWQKLIRRGAKIRFGDECSVRDVHATFFDSAQGSFGEIGEWVEGRDWKFEIDEDVFRRGKQPVHEATHSHEYLAKKWFMAELVRLFHEMGAPELARQYEWGSLKSQPNTMKRDGAGDGPTEGLTALDFRAGLTLLSFLPMSPVDVKLALRGLAQGKLAQFDQGDLGKLESFCGEHDDEFADLQPALDELKRVDPAYRASMPGAQPLPKLLFDTETRCKAKAGVIQGWKVRRLVDDEHAERLQTSALAFPLFLLAGLLPFVGKCLRRLWGNAAWGQHVRTFLTNFGYMQRTFRASQAECLIDWYRTGRTGERGIDHYLKYPANHFCIRIFPGLLPLPPKWHRFFTDWRYAWESTKEAVTYPVRFYRDAAFREAWLVAEIENGAREGMLTPEEKQHVLERVPDPFIQKYLKCVAVHVCTLPITQVISVVVAIWAAVQYGKTWSEAWAYAISVLVVFQFLPISPGSFVRGTYVLYLMIKERNWRNYSVALFVSYWHYIGYLGFPLQMVKEFPTLSRFMAGRWATRMAGIIPVFGEKGALIEHWVFDMFFNVPLTLKRWLDRLKPEPWHRGQVVLALAVAVGLQWLCFSGDPFIGAGQLIVALALDAAIVLRVAGARIADERGRGWLFYCFVLYTSPLWVEIGSRITMNLANLF
jgi:hypothetical protein